MKRLALLCTVAAAFLFSAIPAHAACPISGHPVCGVVAKIINTGMGYEAAKLAYHVKLCTYSGICRETITTTETDWYGNDYQAFAFESFGDGSGNYTQYKVYAWSDYEYWGSDSVPIESTYISGLGADGYAFNAPPRPLPPSTIYPNNGATNIPDHYTVQWYSGIDLNRTGYPANWEVWYKYWPFGGTEPAFWSLSRAGMPCHDNGSGPDANGNCSTVVAGPQPAGNWKWFVRVNLNIASKLPYYMPHPSWFTTDSSAAAFTEP
jgi:hypothetical protein